MGPAPPTTRSGLPFDAHLSRSERQLVLTLMGGYLVSQTAVSLCRQPSWTGALERITSV
jgi:hypothetical protein